MNKLEMAAKARECAEWVREHGFIKGLRWRTLDWDTYTDGNCALGVMERVMGASGWRRMATGLWGIEDSEPGFVAAVAEPLPETWHANPVFRIAAWNNAPERTAEDLVQHFEAVALGLEIQHLAEVRAEAEPLPEAEPESPEPEQKPESEEEEKEKESEESEKEVVPA